MRALELARRALAAAGPHAQVVVHCEQSGMARFAASQIHQPTLVADETVSVQVVLPNGQTGTAAGNRVDDEGLASVAARAAEAARSSPPDPDSPGLAPPAPPPEVDACDEATASLGAGEQARAATAAIEAAALPVYGFFTSGVVELAVVASSGLELEQRLTDATVTVLAADEGASGWATRTSWRAGELDLEGCAREAVAKAERTRGAVALVPGRYRAVLEPYAVGELLQYFGDSCFSGLSLLEERSFFAGRMGERVFAPIVSIADDALDPRNLPRAFDFEGTPKQRVQLVEDGVAAGVVWDRASGRRGAAASTGHALPASQRAWGPTHMRSRWRAARRNRPTSWPHWSATAST